LRGWCAIDMPRVTGDHLIHWNAAEFQIELHPWCDDYVFESDSLQAP
jgi:hypothetical protein